MKRLDASTSHSQQISVEMPGAEFEKCSGINMKMFEMAFQRYF